MDIPEPDFVVTPYGEVDAVELKRLRQNFDTSALLELVERLEPIRQRFELNGGLRDELLRLHRMAHIVVNGANVNEPVMDDLWEVAATLIDALNQTAEACHEFALELQPLADLRPRIHD